MSSDRGSAMCHFSTNKAQGLVTTHPSFFACVVGSELWEVGLSELAYGNANRIAWSVD